MAFGIVRSQPHRGVLQTVRSHDSRLFLGRDVSVAWSGSARSRDALVVTGGAASSLRCV